MQDTHHRGGTALPEKGQAMMHTTDGCLITTIEQTGDYRGEDIGRIWIQLRHEWAWYGGFVNNARRREALAQAQQMTALEFDEWFNMAPL